MSVLVETNVGSFVVDLYYESCPIASRNFLKLCKLKYYNNVLFYHVEKDFIAQTGDPTATGTGGSSIWGVLKKRNEARARRPRAKENEDEKRYFRHEIRDDLTHSEKGVLGMVPASSSSGGGGNASIFYITLRPKIDFLDKKYTIFGKIAEDEDGVLDKINGLHCDEKKRPYIDTRVLHTVILDDPFPDPEGFPVDDPPASPPSGGRPSAEKVERRISHGDKLDENEGRTEEEIQEALADQSAKSKAKILRDLGDLPHEDFAPKDNVLFVAKLNPITNDDDLELIFSRFGVIKSCEIVRDKHTGDSLQYAFIEFETRQQCERAYLKMDGVQIDDRRIKVDFSQSTGKSWNKSDPWKGKNAARNQLRHIFFLGKRRIGLCGKTIGASRRASSAAVFSASSCNPRWNEALEECIENVESLVGTRPDFAIVLSSFDDNHVEGGSSTSVIASVSEFMSTQKQWPHTMGAVVRPLDRRRPPSIQICAGTLGEGAKASIIPATSFESVSEKQVGRAYSVGNRGGATADSGSSGPPRLLNLLLSSEDSQYGFVERHMRRWIPKDSYVAIGTAGQEESGDGTFVEDAPLIFVGPQLFERGIGGIALPLGEDDDDFVVDVVRTVYGDSAWGHASAVPTQKEMHASSDGFQCDAALAHALFTPDAESEEDREDREKEEEQLRSDFAEIQKLMDEAIAAEERGEPISMDVDDGDESYFVDGGESDVYEEDTDGDGDLVADLSDEIDNIDEDDVAGLPFLLAFKRAVEDNCEIGFLGRNGGDGVGIFAVVEELRDYSQMDGRYTAVVRALGRFRCYRSWCTPHDFGAMRGSVLAFEEENEDSGNATREWLKRTVEVAHDLGAVDATFFRLAVDERDVDAERVSWNLATALLRGDAGPAAAATASELTDGGARWLAMSSTLERLQDQHRVFLQARESEWGDGKLSKTTEALLRTRTNLWDGGESSSSSSFPSPREKKTNTDNVDVEGEKSRLEKKALKVMKLEQEANDLKSRRAAMRSEKTCKEREAESLARDLEDEATRCRDLKRRLEKKTREESELRAEVLALETKVRDVSAELRDATETERAATESCERKREEIETIERSVAKVKRDAMGMKHFLEQDMDTLQTLKDALNRAQSSATRETHVGNKEIRTLREEISEKESVLEDLRTEVQSSKDRLNDLCGRLKRTEEESRRSKREIEKESRGEVHEMERVVGNLDELRAEEERLSDIVSSAKRRCTQLNLRLTFNSRKEAELNERVALHHGQVDNLESRRRVRKSERDKVASKLRDVEDEQGTLADQLKDAQEMRRQLTERAGRETSEAKRWESKFADARASEKALSERLRDLRSTATRLNRSVAELREQERCSKAKLESSQRTLADLEVALGDLKKQESASRRRAESAEKANEDLRSESLAEANRAIEDERTADVRLRELKIKLEERSKVVARLNIALTGARSKIDDARVAETQAGEAVLEKKQRLERRITEERTLLLELEETLARDADRGAELEAKRRACRKTAEVLETKLEAATRNLNTRKEEHATMFGRVRSEIAAKTDEAEAMDGRLVEDSKECDELERELEVLVEEIDALGAKIASGESKERLLDARRADAERLLAESKQRVDSMSNGLRDLRSRLREKKAEAAKLRKNLSIHESTTSTTAREMDDEKKKTKRIEKHVHAGKAEVASLEMDLKRRKREFETKAFEIRKNISHMRASMDACDDAEKSLLQSAADLDEMVGRLRKKVKNAERVASEERDAFDRTLADKFEGVEALRKVEKETHAKTDRLRSEIEIREKSVRSLHADLERRKEQLEVSRGRAKVLREGAELLRGKLEKRVAAERRMLDELEKRERDVGARRKDVREVDLTARDARRSADRLRFKMKEAESDKSRQLELEWTLRDGLEAIVEDVRARVGDNDADALKSLAATLALGTIHADFTTVDDYSGMSVRWQNDASCGKNMFCKCNEMFKRANPEMCKTTLDQCHRSFCSPLCLQMTWEPHVRADCSKVPSWVGCSRFAEELVKVERAITAQFQAYVCSTELGCCKNLTRIVDWVEGHVFGDQYPHSLLPTRSCKAAASRSPRIASDTCRLCRQAIEVTFDLDPSRCLPKSGKLKDVVPMSLNERCLFLADKIGTQQHKLKEALRKQACSCAGCCDGECFFRERDHDWLANIIDAVHADFERKGL
eukprot:g477.t1